MATVQFKGDASFTYIPPASFAVTHLLAIPLWEVQPIDRKERHDWWAADLVNRSIVTVGDGVKEIIATIRMDNEPTELKDMLQLALENDLELTYTQDSVAYPVHLVAVIGAGPDEAPLQPDRERLGYGEWECRVHLRRIDGYTLDGIIGG